MKKKLLALTLMCSFALSLSACGGSKNEDSAETSSTETQVSAEASASADSTDTTDVAPEELGTFTFDIPEGFAEAGENYYSPEDTTKFSNINYLNENNDGSFAELTTDMLVEASKTSLEAYYGETVDIQLTDSRFYTIQGCDALRYTIEYTLAGTKLIQTQCIVDAPDLLHFVTYTEIDDEGFLDVFEDSIASIRFE